ncbi:helix-turn-helix domain-containing protein [Psychroflexus sp. MBR-150]
MNLLIQEMTKSDLEHLIQEQLRKVLISEQKVVLQKEPSGSQYLSRSETAKLLKISLPTLTNLVSQGRIQSYSIGKRVLFKRDEVEQALTPIVTSKFKRK